MKNITVKAFAANVYFAISISLVALMAVIVLKLFVYAPAFYALSYDDRAANAATFAAGIEKIGDPVTRAQMTLVERKMKGCRSSRIPGSSIPLTDFWIDSDQITGELEGVNRRCLQEILDDTMLAQPAAAQALAEEARLVGYPIPEMYAAIARPDRGSLAMLTIN